MRVVNPWAWFRGEMQRERLESRERRAKAQAKARAKAVEHPFRSGAQGAMIFAAVMWLAVVRSVDPVQLGLLAVFSVGYSCAYVWFLQRKHERRKPEQGAASPT